MEACMGADQVGRPVEGEATFGQDGLQLVEERGVEPIGDGDLGADVPGGGYFQTRLRPFVRQAEWVAHGRRGFPDARCSSPPVATRSPAGSAGRCRERGAPECRPNLLRSQHPVNRVDQAPRLTTTGRPAAAVNRCLANGPARCKRRRRIPDRPGPTRGRSSSRSGRARRRRLPVGDALGEPDDRHQR